MPLDGCPLSLVLDLDVEEVGLDVPVRDASSPHGLQQLATGVVVELLGLIEVGVKRLDAEADRRHLGHDADARLAHHRDGPGGLLPRGQVRDRREGQSGAENAIEHGALLISSSRG
jgi:hypothetical protein